MSRRVALLALAVLFSAFTVVLPTGPTAAVVQPEKTCTVDARLVNSCRPWFGTSSHNYDEVSPYWNKLAQMQYAEERFGRPVDVAHTYRIAGQNELREEDLYFANRADTILLVNYQPTKDWSTADGSDDVVNAQIDQMAASIKSLGDHRIMLALAHEPENDVTSTEGCSGLTYKGTFGTPAEYRAMWRNVHDRFDAAGVTNVVWVMNYMNYDPFNCMVDELYPGDQYVDWITWNAYQHGDKDVSFVAEASNLYNYFSTHSSAADGRDYLSKAWGLAEWGINGSTQANAYLYYQQAREAVEGNVFPRLKLYAAFDNGDPNTGDGSYRVAYGTDNLFDQAEQDAFNAFASSWALTGDGLPPVVDQPPAPPQAVTPSVGTDGTVTLDWSSALDDLGVVSYDVYRDGTWVATTSGLSWTDSATTAGASYGYTIKALDTAGQVSDPSEPATVTIPVPDTTAPSPPAGLAAAITAGGPRLTWRASTDNVAVAGYDVLRNGTVVGATSNLFFVDTAAPQGRTHTYTVRARDLAGNTSLLSASVRRSVPDTTAPSAPGSFRVARSGTWATLTWTRPTDNVAVTGYIVYRDSTVVSRPGASTLRITVSGLRTGTTYGWRIMARDAAGNISPAASVRG